MSASGGPAPIAGLRARSRGRATAVALTAAIHVLLFLLLWWVGVVPVTVPMAERVLTSFDVTEDAGVAPTPAAEEEAVEPPGATTSPPPPPPPAAAAVPPPVAAPATPVPFDPQMPPGFIHMTRREFAAADVARIPSAAPADVASNAPGTRGSGGAPDSALAGRGPGGEQLYAAEWYREPTNAELATYLPPRMGRGGWGVIACRTAPQYRVEDCQEMDQSPAGSGLARAVRQAAWQFRVRPPRIGGRPQVGAWVRIRIDYTEKPAG